MQLFGRLSNTVIPFLSASIASRFYISLFLVSFCSICSIMSIMSILSFFSFVRNVQIVQIVQNVQIVLFPKLSKMSKNVQIVHKCPNCQKMSKLSKKCPNCPKVVQIVQFFFNSSRFRLKISILFICTYFLLFKCSFLCNSFWLIYAKKQLASLSSCALVRETKEEFLHRRRRKEEREHNSKMPE